MNNELHLGDTMFITLLLGPVKSKCTVEMYTECLVWQHIQVICIEEILFLTIVNHRLGESSRAVYPAGPLD